MPTRMNSTRPPMRDIIFSLKQDVSTVGVLRAWCGRASHVAKTSSEALAAHVAAQSERIQGAGDEITALQDEVASGTSTPHGGRVLRASKHGDFVAQETVLKESKSGLKWAIRVFCARTDVISHTACALLQFSGAPGLPAVVKALIVSLSRQCRMRRIRWRTKDLKPTRTNSRRSSAEIDGQTGENSTWTPPPP